MGNLTRQSVRRIVDEMYTTQTALHNCLEPHGCTVTWDEKRLILMDRKVWAFALVAVAAAVRLDGRRVADARLVLGGVAPIPWRASAAEQALVGAEANDALFARVAEAALAGAEPLQHNAYKVPLAKTLIQRALTTLTQEWVVGA